MIFQLLFAIVYWLIQVIQPIWVPLCSVMAWTLVLLTAWSLWSALRDGVSNAKRMHQIPCANCHFFTGDYHLKCTVRPTTALSEAAIDCLDYESVDS
jgi:hypothetical protein